MTIFSFANLISYTEIGIKTDFKDDEADRTRPLISPHANCNATPVNRNEKKSEDREENKRNIEL